MVIDRDQIMAFLFRLVPPTYAEEARLPPDRDRPLVRGLPARSVVDGQSSIFAVALFAHLALGLGLTALSAVAAGVLMAIPFFGPFSSRWAPPGSSWRLFTKPEAFLPTARVHGASAGCWS
jgi:hypothetical protein